MSQKGPVKYDKDSIVNVVVATRATTSEVRADAERGKKLCTDLLEDESLKGADGEVIREALSSYMDTFTNLSNSCDRVAKIVDGKLEKADAVSGRKLAGNIDEEAAKVGKKVGSFNKQ